MNLKHLFRHSNGNRAYANEGGKTGKSQNPGVFPNSPDSLIFTPQNLNTSAHVPVHAILLRFPAPVATWTGAPS